MSHKNKTVVRSMDILNLFIEHAELSFQEIIDLSGIPKTSVYRMLSSLEEMEFLEKGSDLKYRLGLTFLKFGSLVSARIDIRQTAYPIMKDLHDEVEEAVNLTILKDENETIYIEKIDLKQKVRLYTAVGRLSPLYAGACSRIILANMPDSKIKVYFDRTELKSFSSGTILDEKKLWSLIEQARIDGYTVSTSELYDHTTEVATPIFDHTGNIIAGLSMAGMEANYQKKDIKIYAEKLIIAANKISAQLGYQAKKDNINF